MTNKQRKYELNILQNFISSKPKVYRKRFRNWVVVKHILLDGTEKSKVDDCIKYCMELEISPYGHDFTPFKL